jgi:GT2 family glycosyltransferase
MMIEPTSDEKSHPLAYLVVLNWNSFELTHECILSLQQISYPRFAVLVVDNGSTDDSPERLQRAHPDVEIARCSDNKGIAAGYNRGIEEALNRDADYVVVMNNDLTFAPDFLERMIAARQRWPRAGVIMPKIFYYDEPDIIWSAGGRQRFIPSVIVLRGRRMRDNSSFRHDAIIDYAPSACLLVCREVCEAVRFDEGYFFYFDDWDFCVEVRRRGWDIVFAADSHVWHKVSRSTQNSPKSLRWWRILGLSTVRYHKKHYGLGMLAAHVAWVVARETVKANLRSLPVFLRGVADGLRADNAERVEPGWSS